MTRQKIMSSAIPEFVDQALQEWDFIAYFAYDGYEASGRGVVGLSQDNDGTKAMYGPADYFHQRGNQQVIDMLSVYDPEKEFLVHFDAPGGTRTIRIQTPEGGRHPKRVWFFEILRRASEEPDALPQRLPVWFIEAVEKLSDIEKQ